MEDNPEAFVETSLQDVPTQRRCSVCKNEPLSRGIVRFLDLRKEAETQVPFSWFYREKLKPKFGGPSDRTARDHVRMCLNRNVETGKDCHD